MSANILQVKASHMAKFKINNSKKYTLAILTGGTIIGHKV